MKICVVGTGYVGLVSGACLADLGNSVFCVDKKQNKIDMLNNCHIPIYEPGLEDIVKKNYFSRRLKFTTDLDLAVRSSDLVFICSPNHTHFHYLTYDNVLKYHKLLSCMHDQYEGHRCNNISGL